MNNLTSLIFLSYAHEDIGIAKKLYQDLKKYNLNLWFDTESLIPGQNWQVEIKKAIRKSNFFMALLSKNSVNKIGYVQKELKIALDILDYHPESNVYFIPVRLDNCDPTNDQIFDLHWIDIFPEDKYQEGLKKLLNIFSPDANIIRSKGRMISEYDVYEMIKKYNFYEMNKNRDGKSFFHQFKTKELKGNQIVIDEATGLMWQQSGSSQTMVFEYNFEDELKPKFLVDIYIEKLNNNYYSGFNDWRLPTLDELMSLMEPNKNENGLHIDQIFDTKYHWIWTTDIKSIGERWIVFFASGFCSARSPRSTECYVRAVRSL